MTPKQKENYNKMRACLRTIWKGYKTVNEIRRCSGKDYGLDYIESLEMAYENIQHIAKNAVSDIREI